MSIPSHVFRAYDVRGLVDVDLTPEFARALGTAIGSEVVAQGGTTMAVGFDARASGPSLAGALIEGLCSTGLDVRCIGCVATPHLYHAVMHGELGGGVMVTGSHNPPEYNGFKIMVGQNSLHGSGIQKLLARITDGDVVVADQPGQRLDVDALVAYQNDVLKRLKPLTRPLKVVIDAGNGCGGLASPVLRAMGADVVELYCDADPNFPNHHPDPTVEENLEDLKAAVLAHGADLGVAFDGDVDRIGAVDETGAVIWGDLLTLLFARAILEDRPKAVVIGEVKCSQLLYQGIADAGGVPVMWKAGHSLIKAKMKETGAVLAGEMSGHIFFADRYYGYDDAIYAAGRLLELLAGDARPLSSHLTMLPRLHSTPELRRECASEDQKFALVEAAVKHFSARYKVNDVDGVRIDFGDSWGLVRASNTQPILVLRFEAPSAARLDEIRALVEGDLAELEATLS
jgi:phosphomannomutase/phosphoglucomutase